MTSLPPITPSYTASRTAAHMVGVHVIARARHAATGRFGLRVTPDGFGTPEFGESLERVRVSGGLLVRESGASRGASSSAHRIGGATLAELATFVGVDLTAELSVGHDTPALPDPSAPLHAADDDLRALAGWYAIIAAALDRLTAGAPGDAGPTLAQLWPEHFDVALDLAAAPGARANFGGSPGDGYRADPYLYVGPWGADRPGDASFWNAPFGAVLGYADVAAAADPVARTLEFFLAGFRQLTKG